jgi:hypothetical protein
VVRKSLVLAVIGFSLVMTSQVQAFSHKKKAAAPTENTIDASASQEALVRSYGAAASLVMKAQEEFLLAFGLKDEAAKLSETAKVWGGGSSVSKSEMQAATESSQSANDAIAAKIASGEELSSAGLGHYGNGLGLYGRGLIETKKMADEATAFSNAAMAQISSAPFTNKASLTSKLSAGTYIAKELPGFTVNLTDGLTKAVAYARSADIPVPDDVASLL